MLRNIRLTLAYDGTRYSGWQVQPDRVSVQSTLEDAIEALVGQRVGVLSAGRTDAGVHALGQVANFVVDSTIPPEKWRPALQSKLPHDIVIRESSEAPLDFHATYAAKSKRYRYMVLESRVDDPFVRPYCWRLNGPLDATAMHETGQCLVGTHDFRSFESHWPNTGSSVRTVTEFRVVRAAGWSLWGDRAAPETTSQPDGPLDLPDGRFIAIEIVGDGFLYNMVRSIVGTLIYVGRGTWTAAEFESAFKALDRNVAGETAPAQGLYLVSVTY